MTLKVNMGLEKKVQKIKEVNKY